MSAARIVDRGCRPDLTATDKPEWYEWSKQDDWNTIDTGLNEIYYSENSNVEIFKKKPKDYYDEGYEQNKWNTIDTGLNEIYYSEKSNVDIYRNEAKYCSY